MATQTRTARTLAEEMNKAMTASARADGSSYCHLRDGSPQWMTDAAHAAHGDMLPDDHRYEFIAEALSAFVETDTDADTDALREAIDSIEADIYTHDLTRWLGSRADRYSYCDEALEEFGRACIGGTIELLQLGQLAEKQETAYALLEALEEEAK